MGNRDKNDSKDEDKPARWSYGGEEAKLLADLTSFAKLLKKCSTDATEANNKTMLEVLHKLEGSYNGVQQRVTSHYNHLREHSESIELLLAYPSSRSVLEAVIAEYCEAHDGLDENFTCQVELVTEVGFYQFSKALRHFAQAQDASEFCDKHISVPGSLKQRINSLNAKNVRGLVGSLGYYKALSTATHELTPGKVGDTIFIPKDAPVDLKSWLGREAQTLAPTNEAVVREVVPTSKTFGWSELTTKK
jgi:hypothetical protein